MAVHLVLLAGGRGTRFWPLSTHGKPKQLLPLVSEFSMLRETWNRVSPLGRAERAWVITSDDLAPACRREVEEIPANLESAPQQAGVVNMGDTALLPEQGIDLKEYLTSLERNLIQQALDDSSGVVARAAERLGIRRTTLVEKMRKYDLQR